MKVLGCGIANDSTKALIPDTLCWICPIVEFEAALEPELEELKLVAMSLRVSSMRARLTAADEFDDDPP
jgi:hypothetical protein